MGQKKDMVQKASAFSFKQDQAESWLCKMLLKFGEPHPVA